MDVTRVGRRRERMDLVPRPRDGAIDEPFDRERPRRGVELRCRLRGQHRPLPPRVVLAGRQARITRRAPGRGSLSSPWQPPCAAVLPQRAGFNIEKLYKVGFSTARPPGSRRRINERSTGWASCSPLNSGRPLAASTPRPERVLVAPARGDDPGAGPADQENATSRCVPRRVRGSNAILRRRRGRADSPSREA